MGKLTKTTSLNRGQIRGIVALVIVAGMIGYYSGLMIERGRNIAPAETTLDLPPEIKGQKGSLPLTFHDTLVDGKELPLGSGKNAGAAKETVPTKTRIPERTQQEQISAADDPISNIIAKTETKVQQRPKSVKPASTRALVHKKVLMLQVGSFANAEDAEKLQKSLSTKGYPARVSTADLGEKGIWHRVIVDPYSSMNEAVKVASRLKSEEHVNVLLKERN